jgi:hypothetical protein
MPQVRFCHRLSSFRDAWQVHCAGSPTPSRASAHRGVRPREAIFGGVVGFVASCRCSGLFGTLPVSCGWRSAPQCCAWQSVRGRCRVRQLLVPLGRKVGAIGSRRSRLYRLASSAARNPRDAQPFHGEDSPRQAGSSLSCQTLGGARLATTQRLVKSRWFSLATIRVREVSSQLK